MPVPVEHSVTRLMLSPCAALQADTRRRQVHLSPACSSRPEPQAACKAVPAALTRTLSRQDADCWASWYALSTCKHVRWLRKLVSRLILCTLRIFAQLRARTASTLA